MITLVLCLFKHVARHLVLVMTTRVEKQTGWYTVYTCQEVFGVDCNNLFLIFPFDSYMEIILKQTIHLQQGILFQIKFPFLN